MAVKEVYYTDPDWEAILAQQDDGVDPFAAAKQDLMDNQDDEHRPPYAVSGANCVPEQTVPPFQREKLPLIARFRVIIDRPPQQIGEAASDRNLAQVMQSQRIEGVVATNEETDEFTQLDLGKSRRTNPNAAHVPVRDLKIVDLANTTASFLDAGNKVRIPIKRRPEAIFTPKDAK